MIQCMEQDILLLTYVYMLTKTVYFVYMEMFLFKSGMLWHVLFSYAYLLLFNC